MRTKKTKRDLNRLRALAAAPLEWCEMPGWVLGNDSPSILIPLGERGDDITLAADVSREAYLAALAAAVEAGELTREYTEPERQAASWIRFEQYRAGDHGPHPCSCSPACIAKQPAPPLRSSAVPATETFRNEGGTDRRSSRETPEPDEEPWQAEQRRLNRIANEATIRYFT